VETTEGEAFVFHYHEPCFQEWLGNREHIVAALPCRIRRSSGCNRTRRLSLNWSCKRKGPLGRGEAEVLRPELRFNFEFSGTLGAALAKYERINHWSDGRGMWNSAPVRWTFSAMSTLFGGLGVFLLYVGFDDPTEIPRALIFLGSAITIVWSSQYSAKAPTDSQ
jgi:hypothetical protein